VSLHKRLERLEDTAGDASRADSRAALRLLSDEELDALEKELEREGGTSPEERYRLQEITEIEQALEQHTKKRLAKGDS
jgi:hypothetical protein